MGSPSRSVPPSLKSATATLIWRQEGRDGTETRSRSCLRAGSCHGVGRPSDRDVGGPPPESRQFGCAYPAEADDLPGSKLEFVLKGQAMRNERLRCVQVCRVNHRPGLWASQPSAAAASARSILLAVTAAAMALQKHQAALGRTANMPAIGPHCGGGRYKLVRAKLEPPSRDLPVHCKVCKQPLAATDGDDIATTTRGSGSKP